MDNNIKITINSYDKTFAEYAKKTSNLHPIKEAKKFTSYLHKNALILDLGCGPGRDARIFVEKGLKVIGIDLSKKMIEAAKKQAKHANFYIMDVRKLRFKDNYFDGIWSSASLLHIPKKDILKGLQEVHRVLKNQGIFYFSLKQGRNEILMTDKRYSGVKKFFSLYQKKEIEKILRKVGFSIWESYVKKEKNTYATNRWIQIFCVK